MFSTLIFTTISVAKGFGSEDEIIYAYYIFLLAIAVVLLFTSLEGPIA